MEIIEQMSAIGEEDLDEVEYFNLRLELSGALAEMELTTYAIVGLATDAMRLSEGDLVRQDGVRSLLNPISTAIAGVQSALSAERERLADIVADPGETLPWAFCHWLTAGCNLARLLGMQVWLAGVQNQNHMDPIGAANGFINGANNTPGINDHQAIMAEVDYTDVYAYASNMLDQGDIMLSSYNDSENSYLVFYNAKASYYTSEDNLLGGTTASNFGAMGDLLDQISDAIEAAKAALAMEDDTAHDDMGLNNGVTDQFRREGIRANLEAMHSNLSSIAAILSQISSQVDAIEEALDAVDLWYMFAYPDPQTAVKDECGRAYYGFTDNGVEVNGIGCCLIEIGGLLDEEF